jgi:hypothetical protein
MKKIKISHETPFCLLKHSLKFCDYQYALPHLLEDNEDYRNHFLQCKEDGVEMYLDNSLHELSYAMDDATLIKWMNILEPSTFFVPDAWEDYDTSVVNARRWSTIVVPETTTKTAVVQAKSWHEAMLCIQAYRDLGYKKFAFSYGASYYNKLCPALNPDFGKAIGRFIAISKMYEEGILLSSDRVHLLGTAWPGEFSLYRDMPFIESLDTSNPIMAALDGTIYREDGVSRKPTSNMNNYQDLPIEDIAMELVEYNVRKFRSINGL